MKQAPLRLLTLLFFLVILSTSMYAQYFEFDMSRGGHMKSEIQNRYHPKISFQMISFDFGLYYRMGEVISHGKVEME